MIILTNTLIPIALLNASRIGATRLLVTLIRVATLTVDKSVPRQALALKPVTLVKTLSIGRAVVAARRTFVNIVTDFNALVVHHFVPRLTNARETNTIINAC